MGQFILNTRKYILKKKGIYDGPIHSLVLHLLPKLQITDILYSFGYNQPKRQKTRKLVIEKRKTLNKLSTQIKSLAHCHMNTNLDNASFYNLRMFSRSVPKVIVYICPKDIGRITTNPTCDKFLLKQYNATSRWLLYRFPFLLYSPSLWICKIHYKEFGKFFVK